MSLPNSNCLSSKLFSDNFKTCLCQIPSSPLRNKNSKTFSPAVNQQVVSQPRPAIIHNQYPRSSHQQQSAAAAAAVSQPRPAIIHNQYPRSSHQQQSAAAAVSQPQPAIIQQTAATSNQQQQPAARPMPTSKVKDHMSNSPSPYAQLYFIHGSIYWNVTVYNLISFCILL